MSIKDRVAVIGVGCTKFGELFDMSYEDLAVEAAFEALADANISPEDIEATWLGTEMPSTGNSEGRTGASLANYLKLGQGPVTRVANYCATGTDSFRNACFAVACGAYKIALVIGVEKMRDVESRSLINGYVEWGHPLYGKGNTLPGMFALSATRYFSQYEAKKEHLAKIAVKNHYNGSLNPKAHFQRAIDFERALKAPMVAEPLGLFDCCPTTDGGAAAVICSADIAADFKKDYVLVKGTGLATGRDGRFHQGNQFAGFQTTFQAAGQAYKEAGITDPRREINFGEIHDCFTITELLTYEGLGFCEVGGAARFIDEGTNLLDGSLPRNTSGGLKSCGHPIGATGVRQIGEVTNQILGRADKRQVKNARTGLAHNIGLGVCGEVACVVVLGAK